jgi:tetratricopeptide (TPR) repeat protein
MTEESQDGSASGATDLAAAEQGEEHLRSEEELLTQLESPPSTADNHPGPVPFRSERDPLLLSRSQQVVAACTEIYAVAKTALDEVNQSAGHYLTFHQKKRIHAQAANFAAASHFSLSPALLTSSPQRPENLGQDEVNVEEIERRILSRVQDSLHSELALLASQTETASPETGSGVSEQLDGLALALRALERSLPGRIKEVVDSRSSVSAAPAPAAPAPAAPAQVALLAASPAQVGLLAAVQEVRSASTGFSIADLDLGAIAALTDRAGDTHLPRLGPALVTEATLPYEAPINLVVPAAEAVPELTPQTAVVFLDEPVSPTPAPPLAAVTPPRDLHTTAFDEDGVSILEEAHDSDAIDEAQLESIDLDLSELAYDAPDDSVADVSPISENLVLAPVVSEEDSVELDLGGITGDVSPPDSPALPDVPEPEAAEVERAEPEAAESASMVPEAPQEAGEPEAAQEAGEPEAAQEVGEPEAALEGTIFIAPLVPEGAESDEEVAEALVATVLAEPVIQEPTTPAPDPLEGISAPENNTEVEIRLQHAAELRGRNKLAESMKQYDEVIELTGPNYEAHIGRGVVFLQTRNYQRAAAEFSMAEQLDSKRPAGALGLAEVSFHQKQFAEAIEHYSTCIQLDPRLAQAFRNRGLCHYHQNDYDQSADDLRRAFELDPSLPNIKKYLKIAQNKQRAEDEASGAEATS